MKLLPSLFDASCPVPDSELKAFLACPVCEFDHSSTSVVLGVLQKEPKVSLIKCDNCFAVSASHRPSDHFLEKYYGECFVKHYQDFNTEGDVTFSDTIRFATHLRKMLNKGSFCLPVGSIFVIVDYGGGDGSLALSYARCLPENLDVEIYVVDYGDNVCNSVFPNIKINKTARVDDIKCLANLVIASASLEHVPNLSYVIKRLWGLMDAGAFFYSRTPYIMPLKKFLPVEFGFPAHIHDLGSEYWNNLDLTYGFDLKYIFSRPSIVEVTFNVSKLRWFVAHLLKLPCKVELLFFPFKRRQYFWPFVGGWEVLLRKER